MNGKVRHRGPPDSQIAAAAAGASVRIATARDTSFVLALQARFSNQLGFLPRQAVVECIEQGLVLVATDNDAEAGYLLRRRRLASTPAAVPLIQTAICYDAQRRHLGLALLRATATAALADGRTFLTAWCRADLPANEFWRAAGFLPIAQRQTSNARRQPLILWRLPLTANCDADFLSLPRRAGHHGRPLSNGKLLSPAELARLLAA